MTTGDTSEGNGRYTEVIDLFDKENVCQMVQKSDYPFEVMKATGQAVKLDDNHTDFIICGGMAPRTGKDFQVLWICQAGANMFYLTTFNLEFSC